MTEFSTFAGIQAPEEMRLVTRAHVIAWLEHKWSQALDSLVNSTLHKKIK